MKAPVLTLIASSIVLVLFSFALGDELEDYRKCLALAEEDPATAREAAARWEAIGGGVHARHCSAMALMGLGADKQAAQYLTELGTAEGTLSAPDRAAALRTAGQLWLQVGQPQLSQQTFAAAYKLTPSDAAPLIGMARAAAALGAYDQAQKYLSDAQALSPGDPQILTLRAAARRRLGDLENALTDARLATELKADNALAWFERGSAELALGLRIDAQESFLQASTLDPAGTAGEMARIQLQQLVLGQ
ncbi:MAG: tetratricopeptide repeat protein [Neomegalonema sp.]|nr:tetratricopeptide repeat protein [Neomegalonema sp.]